MGSESDENTNLVFLERSRKKLREGDVFAFRLLDGPYRFGRVIRADIEGDEPIPKTNLVYVYDATAADPDDPPVERLTTANLLLPPMFINRQGWLRGYFKTVAHHSLEPGDVLDEHCFWWGAWKKHVDLHGNQRAEAQPCGTWGVASHRVLDDEVSAAVGLPHAPD